MAENMGKWPSGHGKLTKTGHLKAVEGKPLQWRRNLGMIAMDLGAIWEMSDELSSDLNYAKR